MAGALQGVRVVDFGQYIAGPMAAMLLGDHGADVIRVDPPGGPRWDTAANATWNRNKRSIVLDLKQAADLARARELVARADVLIENFRPGVMDRLGLGHEAMMKVNPRLLYCSMPGFAADDPRAGVRAWEGVLGAATATYRREPEFDPAQPPIYTVIPFSSVYGAFISAVSIGFALNARERSGQGQRIEVPLFDATFTVIGQKGLRIHNAPPPPPPFMWSRQLRTKDGRWFMYVHLNKRFQAFLEAIGAAGWQQSGMGAAELERRFGEVFLTRTGAEWERFCEDIGTEGAVSLTSAEWLRHPQALQSGSVADFDDPVLGSFRGPAINVNLSVTPASVRAARAMPDAHRAQILAELARPAPPAQPPAAPETLHGALQGVKVLDLCIIIAGPTCGRTLAEFGADVVKIDSARNKEVRQHNEVNRGKRSILIDLKTDEGMSVFWRLLEDADVVMQNFRKGVAERLGVGYEQVKARKPGIIYVSTNTFGQTGPCADRPGHEQIAQAVSGMQVRYGGDGRPVVAPFPANDFGTGIMAAFGVAMAMLHKRRTGEGQHIDSSLIHSAAMMQSALLQDHPGKRWDEPRGQDCLGRGPLYRAYRAADGWVFMAARDGDLRRCAELADLAGMRGEALGRALEARLRERGAAAWVAALTRAGIGAHEVVLDIRTLMDSELAHARGVSLTREHEGFGPITTTGPGQRLSLTPVQAGKPASRPGSDARSVLDDIGLGGELDRLVRERIVVVEGVKAVA